ncbi:hypothetical protein DPEC_G00073580, partial [Dallia pectoralis]
MGGRREARNEDMQWWRKKCIRKDVPASCRVFLFFGSPFCFCNYINKTCPKCVEVNGILSGWLFKSWVCVSLCVCVCVCVLAFVSVCVCVC